MTLLKRAFLSSSLIIRIANPQDLDSIRAAYRNWDYGGGIAAGDTAWLAEYSGEMIGVVRVAPENGTLVLRGMRIAVERRRHGIGSHMLRDVAAWLGGRECYCVPYAHLVNFYAQIGSAEITTATAPAFLASPVAEYRRGGLEVTLMLRPAS